MARRVARRERRTEVPTSPVADLVGEDLLATLVSLGRSVVVAGAAELLAQ